MTEVNVQYRILQMAEFALLLSDRTEMIVHYRNLAGS